MTITSAGKTSKLTIQLGAYASFQSFFGLANLTAASEDFYGVPDYASSMTFELFTTAPPEPFPAIEDLKMRFLFHNGTTSNTSAPMSYPLFGSQNMETSWTDFVDGMNKFAVGDQEQWCRTCGNSTGVCAFTSATSSSSSSNGRDGTGGISRPVAGVIGAMVTLVFILGVEAAVLLLVGLRIVKRKRSVGADGVQTNRNEAMKG